MYYIVTLLGILCINKIINGIQNETFSHRYHMESPFEIDTDDNDTVNDERFTRRRKVTPIKVKGKTKTIEIHEKDVNKLAAVFSHSTSSLDDDDDEDVRETTNQNASQNENKTKHINNTFKKKNSTKTKHITKPVKFKWAFTKSSYHHSDSTKQQAKEGKLKKKKYSENNSTAAFTNNTIVKSVQNNLGADENENSTTADSIGSGISPPSSTNTEEEDLEALTTLILADPAENVDKQTEIFSKILKHCQKRREAMDEIVSSLAKIVAQQQTLLMEQEGALREQEKAVSAVMSAKGEELISKLAIQKVKMSNLESEVNTLDEQATDLVSLKSKNDKMEDISKGSKKQLDPQITILLPEDKTYFSKAQSELILKLGELEKQLDHSKSFDKQTEMFLQKLKQCNQCEKINQAKAEHADSLGNIAGQQQGLLEEQKGVLREQTRVVSALMSKNGQELISKLAIQKESLSNLEEHTNTLDARFGVEGTSMKSLKHENAKIQDLERTLGNVISTKEGSQGNEKVGIPKDQIAKNVGMLKDVETKGPNFLTATNVTNVGDPKNYDKKFIIDVKPKITTLNDAIDWVNKETFTNLDQRILGVMENAVKIEENGKSKEAKIACERVKIPHMPGGLPLPGIPIGSMSPSRALSPSASAPPNIDPECAPHDFPVTLVRLDIGKKH